MMLQQQLQQTPTMTDSIFPVVEAWLYHEDADHWGALEQIAPKRSLGSYTSVVDFLLCEAVPERKTACRQFYQGRGPQLRDLITEQERRRLELRMLVLCRTAYRAFCEQRRCSWRSVRETARQMSRAA